MCLFGMLGLTGLYARQANHAGWLGLIGYLLFSFFLAHTLPLVYTEAFILPLLASEAPRFVEGMLGIFNGHPIPINLVSCRSSIRFQASLAMFLAACSSALPHSAPESYHAGRLVC